MTAIKIGSVAYNGTRWNLVMKDDALLPLDKLKEISKLEKEPLVRAIRAATEVMQGKNKTEALRFNRAENTPPSTRMERLQKIGAHTFYRFKIGLECGEWKK